MNQRMQSKAMKEITVRVLVLSTLLTILLAISNAYLALKIGILTSASIPAAVISMGVLRLFRDATILENNLVQTAASAGEAVAGGIVYTIPALVIIHYWHHFNYWENFFIAAIGGLLGVLFSIPIRRVLVTEKTLHFPEAQAIAAVLQVGEVSRVRLTHLVGGCWLGAVITCCQNGLKIMAGSWQYAWQWGQSVFVVGLGFSTTLLGAGFLIGFPLCFSIFVGACVGWLLGLPILSATTTWPSLPANELISLITQQRLSYIGISAMLCAGLLTLIGLYQPFRKSLQLAWHSFRRVDQPWPMARIERDIPLRYVLLSLALLLAICFFIFPRLLPLYELALSGSRFAVVLCVCLCYVFLVGFIFSAITGYFSGMVGVTASPGSAIVIGGLLLAALMIQMILTLLAIQFEAVYAQATVIILGALITGAAAIANDNIQDLKVGHLIGATPWKQQIMLAMGVLISAAVIPPIMELMLNTYGIADVLPHPGMRPENALPAPPAALMARMTQSVFNHQIPWSMFLTGLAVVMIILWLNRFMQRSAIGKLSPLGVAIGIYLPLSTSIPLFIGGVIAYLFERRTSRAQDKQHGVLLACGLIVGSILMDVLLAIPFSLSGSVDAWRVIPATQTVLPTGLGILSVLIVIYYFCRIAKRHVA